MAGFTGQGTTVALASGSVSCVRSLTLPTWSMDSIDASCLSDTGFMKKVAADLVDAGSVQVTAVFSPSDSPWTPSNETDTLTVTLPTAGASGGILTGTGFISESTLPSIEIGGLMEQSFTFTFDGVTGPTFTSGVES